MEITGPSAIKGFSGFSNLNSEKNYSLTTLIWRYYGTSSSGRNNDIDLSGLEYYKNLTTLYINDCNITNLDGLINCKSLQYAYFQRDSKLTDISGLKNCTNLLALYINNDDSLSDISVVENFEKLVTLYANDCSINDIYALKNLTDLETIYLQNNALSDFSSHNGVSYETMDIFYDLNYEKKGALKNLYISGNNIDDTEILLDLNWNEKSGF